MRIKIKGFTLIELLVVVAINGNSFKHSRGILNSCSTDTPMVKYFYEKGSNNFGHGNTFVVDWTEENE